LNTFVNQPDSII